MFKNKRNLVIGSLLGILLFLVTIYIFIENQKYSYEWKEIKESSIGQYTLYINDVFGNHIDGTARLVYINGKTKRVDVPKKGLIYVKSIVAEVRNPNRK